jgi:hypothetical protein
MCLNLSATVILACLFMPKVKVVLLKPNKNVRKTGNMLKATAANGVKETKIVQQNAKSKLGKFAFLWPVVAENSFKIRKKIEKTTTTTTVDDADERTFLTKQQKQQQTVSTTETVKKVSRKDKPIVDAAQISEYQKSVSVNDSNSNITSSNSNIEESTTLRNTFYTQIYGGNTNSTNEQHTVEVSFGNGNDDDEFFIVNKEARENFLISNSQEEFQNIDGKVCTLATDEEEFENQNKETNIIIFDGEKSVETTFNYFNKKTVFLNSNKRDRDEFPSMRITFV